MTQDLTQLTAAEIAHGIRLGRFSSVEVTEQHLDRIHARNDRTNSFITVTDELARELASYADDAIASGTVFGPLHGVPVAIKDLDDVEGVRRTSGSLLFEDNVSEADAPFVERLKAAGAVIVGKTNTPEFALGTTTDNRIIGKTGAPFDPDRVAGGSSGGAAAAVGDNLVPLAQGSDTGGSIRAPASFCGVYGLKPTFGVIPKVSRPDGFAIHTPFSHHGPLTRTVEDAALMLDVMAGEHPKDPFSVPARDTYTSAINRPIDELRIAYSPDLGLYPIDPAVRATLDDAISAFERAGATVERTDPEFGLEQDEIVDAYYTFATAR